MELKVKPLSLPEAIDFNFEELKNEITTRASAYVGIVYSDAQMKEAKTDVAMLRKFVKALSDERIRVKKEILKPYDEFEGKVKDLTDIVDTAIANIDKQIKEYETIKQDEKRMNIEEMFKNMLFPDFVKVEQVWNPKWLNATFTMKQIEEELLGQKNRITSECQTLAGLPNYHTEAVHFYQKTLNIEQALAKVRELTEVDKAREEARKVIEETAEEVNNRVKAETLAEPKMWVAFEAYLNKTTAAMLKDFFEHYDIEFKPIKIKEEA